MDTTDIGAQYEEQGFVQVTGLYCDDELKAVHEVLVRFHESWLKANAAFYQERAVNSAYVTGTRFLNDEDRQVLFEFIGSKKISAILTSTLPGEVMFVGAQLFFDPANPEQKNYWHRDIQYNDLTIEEQKQSLKESNPLHLRIAMKPERGVELVPGTHRRWDTEEEFDIRMERNSRRVHEDLSTGLAIEMARGDLLLFSAGMIHRGLYGGHRFALDLLFGNADPSFARFVDEDCLPDTSQLGSVACPAPFNVTRRLK